jgi:hypothetical protein
MNWLDSAMFLPGDGQEVLIRRNDDYTLAIFDSTRNRFILRGGLIVEVGSEPMLWAAIVPPAK